MSKKKKLLKPVPPLPLKVKKEVGTELDKSGGEESTRPKIKGQAYKAFLIWLVIPSILKGQSEEQYHKKGIIDPTYIEIASIKSRKEFSEKFNVSENTMSTWSKDVAPAEADTEMHKFFNQLTQNLVLSFYNEQLVKPTPQGIETWYEIIKDRSRNLNINLEGKITHDLDDEAKARIRHALSQRRKG